MKTYHDDRGSLANLARALQLLLLVLELDLRLVVAAGDLLEVNTSSIRDIVVITLADLHHGLPVVLVQAKDQCEDGDQGDGREQRGNVASQHGVVGPGAGHVERAALLLGSDEPGDEGADEAEDGRERRCPLVLAGPKQLVRNERVTAKWIGETYQIKARAAGSTAAEIMTPIMT